MSQVLWWNEHPDVCDSPGMWDQYQIADELLRGFDRVSKETFTNGVIVVPGRFHSSPEDTVAVGQFQYDHPRSVVIITSDEEQLSQPWLKGRFVRNIGPGETETPPLWVMTPRVDETYLPRTRFIGSGYTPHTDPMLIDGPSLNFVFMGQITHRARQVVAEQLNQRDDGFISESEGFTEGLDPIDYNATLGCAKIAPCPPGVVSPDSFRFYEALEMGCLPVLDINDKKYWSMLYGKLPPVLYTDGWENINETIDKGLNNWLKRVNISTAWWKCEKWQMRERLKDDLHRVGAELPDAYPISFLVSVSPINDHPDSSTLRETVDSIRERAAEAPIFLMFDGVRPEQQEYAERYQQHIRDVLIKTADDPNVIPVIMKEWQHQALMSRRTMKLIRTPLICFMEHDTPLIGDIPFEELARPLMDRTLDMLRFHHEAGIHPEHERLMIDRYRKDQPWLRTIQWSQRPHLARSDFYRRILNTYFGRKSRTMIEDLMYSVVVQAWDQEGMRGWSRFRLAIYNPEDTSIKRSTHLDGRGDDPKYPMRIAFDRAAPLYGGPERINR